MNLESRASEIVPYTDSTSVLLKSFRFFLDKEKTGQGENGTSSLGTRLSHQMIYRWIGKYTALMEKYLDERTNGGIRDREEVMQGLQRKDSPILTGCQLFQYRSRAKTLSG
jgi:hypothetical protein